MMLCGNPPPLGDHNGASKNTNSSSKYYNYAAPPKDQRTKAQRQAEARKAAAKSKSKLWGPSHSFDSDDTDNNNNNNNNNSNYGKLGAAPRQTPVNASWWENMGKVWTEFGTGVQLTAADFMNNNCHKMSMTTFNNNSSKSSRKQHTPMEPVKEEPGENEDDDSTDPSTHEDEVPNHTPTTNTANTKPTTPRQKAAQKVEEWTHLFSNACGAMGAGAAGGGAAGDGTACSPCSAQELEEIFGQQRVKTHKFNQSQTSSHYGIAPLTLDQDNDDDEEQEDSIFNNVVQDDKNAKQQQQQQQRQQPPLQPSLSDESPADRRRQRAMARRKRHEHAATASASLSSWSASSAAPHEDYEVNSKTGVVLVTQRPPSTTHHTSGMKKKSSTSHGHNQNNGNVDNTDMDDDAIQFPPLPLEELLVKPDEAQELERSISELTMKSSYQDVTPRRLAGDQRRMAYYAVGRHHRQQAAPSGPKSGGNRRCYFTGKLIFGGAPFYAGIVQQGLRTLVVFCLPSALGMPQNIPGHVENKRRQHSILTSSNGSVRTGLLQRSRHKSETSLSQLSKGNSKISSVINIDDMSLSIEGDLDPNWNLDKDYLLSILPEPSNDLLAEMNQRYPEQFETLPVQVRHASCWHLYVKFCFFSGLPIAEGELHYQVRHNLAMEVYGEDIVLSYDVMEAVNGVSSAEILKLPNLKTFRYLKKHYQQQSAKLPEVIFQRTSWEQVKPEV